MKGRKFMNIKWIDIVIGAIIVLMAGGAIFYIYRAKKSGKKCIGCPDSGCCNKKGSGGCDKK